MHRFTVSLVVVMVLFGLTTIGGLRTSAQEATPAAGAQLFDPFD